MATEKPAGAYGMCKELFVTRKAGGDSFIVGGVAEDSTRWTRVLSQRAVQIIWFHLGQFVNEDKTKGSAPLLATAPIRHADAPTITSHTAVDKTKDGHYQILGWAGEKTWSAHLSAEDALSFWNALDTALGKAKDL
jgi:hypothetical protein